MWTTNGLRLFRALVGGALLSGALLSGALLSGVASAQSTDVAPESSIEREAAAERLPDPLRTQLANVTDFVYHFDFPAYYALVDFVQETPTALAPGVDALTVDDWQTMVATPSAFRGRVVHVEGIVGLNKPPHRYPNHPQIEPVSQLELYRPGQPISASVICTSDVGDIPRGAEVELDAYFLSVKKFRDQRNREQLSLVFVARGPSVVRKLPLADATVNDGAYWSWIIAAAVVGLALAWIMLRRATRHPTTQRPFDRERPRTTPTVNLSDELEAWAERSAADQDRDDH
jgi:hypothetical protein